MKFRFNKPGALALSLMLAFHLHLTGCSSSPQDGEELQNSEEAANSEEGGDQNTENYKEGEEASAENSNSAEDTESLAENAGEGGETAEEGQAVTGNESEQDLQDIISELNTDGSAPANSAAPANGAAPMNSAAPANGMAEVASPMTGAPAGMNQGSPAASVAGGSYLPETGSKMPYVVQKGDTLAKIATKIYGSSGQWQKIQELTQLSNPDRIYPGDVVYYHLDNGSNGFAQQYENIPRKQVSVQKGDTLSSIAAQVYGTSAAWKFLWRENGHIDNPDQLTVGTAVYYKEFASGTPLAEIEAINAKQFSQKELSMGQVSMIPRNMI